MPSKSRKDQREPDLYQDEATLGRKAVQLVRWLHRWETAPRTEHQMVSFSVYPPTIHRPKWLVVFKRGISPYREVLFQQSPSFFGALLGGFQRIADPTTEWKTDEYDPARSRR